jgi:hypothetical protein
VPCDPPFKAAKCDDESTARSAAAAGSNACSIVGLSCAFCCKSVGDEFFGVDPRKSFLVENFLDNPPLDCDCVEDGVGAGGEMIFEVS